jgi:integrase
MSNTRRGRNEGMIRYIESKKLYEARYTIGVDENGRTVYKSIYGKKKTGSGGVQEKMRDALAALGKGEYVDPSGKSLIGWCKEWYETYKEPKLKTNTKEKYQVSLIRLKKYEIANIRLKDLSLEFIQKFYNRLAKDGYSEETIKATHSLINGALEKADEINLIIKNPAKHATIPKVSSESSEDKDAKALTTEQCEDFMEQLGRRTKHYMYAFFMLNTGLRPGEALALTRADIDLKKKTVKVNKTYLERSKKVQNSTKTVASKRTVPIPDNTIKLLTQYMLKQPKKKPEDPLFQTETGKRPSQSYLRKRFKFAGTAIGCPWVNLHTMRHSFASRLFKEGVDVKIVSSLLGHAKISTTYDIYVHFINNIVTDSVNLLNSDIYTPDMLPKKSKKKVDCKSDLKNVIDI